MESRRELPDEAFVPTRLVLDDERFDELWPESRHRRSPRSDSFFQHYVGQNQFKLHLAVTWVAARQSDLLGFATIAGGSLERRTMPDAALRRRLPDHPLPVVRLARPSASCAWRASARACSTAALPMFLDIATIAAAVDRARPR